MLKKIRLDNTKSYEIAITTEKIAEMLVKYVLGYKHIVTIGCDQGDIEKWDDLILQLEDGTLEHIQVKRNFNDFSDHPCKRANKTKGKNTGQPLSLSPIDESIKALSDWTRNNDPSHVSPSRSFVIEVPDMTTKIKHDIKTGDLYNFCRDITDSTTATSLQNATDSRSKNIFDWLRTWCDFDDWNHILRAIRRLNIRNAGTESEIEARTELMLSRCFLNSHQARLSIHKFIDKNSSFTSAITPRPLLRDLKTLLLPGIKTWTQYINDGFSWEISGINDSFFGAVERPKFVVENIWAVGKESALKVECGSKISETLPDAIRRLVFHMQSPSIAHISNSEIWKERASKLVGGTLGIGEADFSAIPVIEQAVMHSSSDCRLLTLSNQIDDESRLMIMEMNSLNWAAVSGKVHEKILSMQPSVLKTAIEQRWLVWEIDLDGSVDDQIELCSTMMHPSAEGGEITPMLRVGPRTALLIAKGIHMLLVVSVSLSDIDQGWKNIGANLSIGTKALEFWSGPSGKSRSVRRLTDEGISELIGREPVKILILSAVEANAFDIQETSLAEIATFKYNIASGHNPILIVTNSMKIRGWIADGNLNSLRQYFQTSTTIANNIKQEQLNSIMP